MLRKAQAVSQLLRRSRSPAQGLSLRLRDSPRHFSSEDQSQASPIDPFLNSGSSGLVYGRLSGGSRHTLKTDIVNLLDGCNLTVDDIKFEYDRKFDPVSITVQFPSLSAYDTAIKNIARKGRLFRLEKTDRSKWDFVKPYDGKYILMQGLPRGVPVDDVERFLSGCDYDASSLEMFMRQAIPDKMAIVRFSSKVEAMNAAVRKNRGFCQNNQILVRVLQ